MLPLRGLATLESSWEAEAWGPHSIGGAEPLRSFADGCRDAASLRSQPASSRTVTRMPGYRDRESGGVRTAPKSDTAGGGAMSGLQGILCSYSSFLVAWFAWG